MTNPPQRVVRVVSNAVRVISVAKQGRPGAQGNEGAVGPAGLAMLTLTGELLSGAGTPESPLTVSGVAPAVAGVGETYADALPISLAAAVAATPRLRLAPRAYPLSDRLVQSGSVLATGATLAPTSGLATSEAVRLNSGAEVISGTMDGAAMPGPTVDYVGGVVPPGSAYAAEGASSAAPVSGLRLDTTVSNIPQSMFYGTFLSKALLKLKGTNIGTATNAHVIASAVVVVDGTDVTADIDIDGAGLKGVSFTRVQGGLMTGRVTNGNTGHAGFFQRLGRGVRTVNVYTRGGFGYKNDGGEDSLLNVGVFEDADGVMLQGGKGNIVSNVQSINPVAGGIRVGYHPTNITPLIDCGVINFRVRYTAGVGDVSTAQTGLVIEAGPGSTKEVRGLSLINGWFDGGYQGIQQKSVTGGELWEVFWNNLNSTNVVVVGTFSPLSGTIANLKARNVTRGVILTGQSGAPAGGVLTLRDWDFAMTGTTTSDLGLSVSNTVKLDHLIIDGLRTTGGYRALTVSVGLDGSSNPLIKKLTIRNLRGTGGLGGTGVFLTIPGTAASNVILELENNTTDKALTLSGTAWTVAQDVNNISSSRSGFPSTAPSTSFTGLEPAGGSSWTLGQYLTNTAPSIGTWSSLTIAAAGISGTPNATVTATAGSATATVNQLGNLAVGQRIVSSGVLATRTITAINGLTLTLNTTANTTATGPLEFVDKATYYGTGWIGTVTRANLPSASTYPNSRAVVSDPQGGNTGDVISDGTNWRYVGDGTLVSAKALTYTGSAPAGGTSCVLGEYWTNLAPTSGTWRGLLVATAGNAGVPNATITTTNGSATATVDQIGNLAVGQRISSSGVLAVRTITAINGLTLTLNATANVSGTGVLDFVDKAAYNGSGWVGAVTRAALPSAATYPNSPAVVSDPQGGNAGDVISDGTNWRYVGDGTLVSAKTLTYTGLAPTGGTSCVVGEFWSNLTPTNGTWRGLLVATAGNAGTPNATITTTATSTTATVDQIGNLAVGQVVSAVGVLPTRTITAINGLTLTLNSAANTTGTAALAYVNKAAYNGSAWVGVVAKASLPAAATYPSSLAVISDPAASKSRSVVSDGTAWRYAGDDSLV